MLATAPHMIELALSAGLATAGICYPTFWPASGVWGPIVSRGKALGSPRVALTFDDGPLPGATNRILDLLGELNVKASFFVIGRMARENPQLLRRIHEQGHIVGNHSFDHLGLGFLYGQDFWHDQIERTDRVIEQEIGARPKLFRPPLGAKTWMIARAARSHTVVTWNRRARDGIATQSQRILDRVLPRTRAGDIVALHDGVSPQSRRDPMVTVAALRPLIAGLRERGIEPVRLDDLTGVEPYFTAATLPNLSHGTRSMPATKLRCNPDDADGRG
jgi:peptidoglycan/xylan/chitin deacetylase (PgdA/CDA1 family)